MKANPTKFIGILCGALRGTTPPQDLGEMADLIHWLKGDEFTKILRIPFWMQGDETPFWEALYLKINKKFLLDTPGTRHPPWTNSIS
jgi:hypothetical protein